MSHHTSATRGGALGSISTYVALLALLFLASCHPSPQLAKSSSRDSKSGKHAQSQRAHKEPLFPGLLPKRKAERELASRTPAPSRSTTPARSTRPATAPSKKPSRDRRTVDAGSELKGEARLRQHIEAYAESYIGTPYRYGAKGPGSFDCSGFTSYVLKAFDIALLNSSMSQAKQGRAVDPRDAKPGDIVYFANSDGRVNHVGVVVANSSDGLEIVHASSSQGIVRDNVTHSSYWSARLAGARCVVDCRVGMIAAY